MRTTLTLDDDVAETLQRLARGRRFKEVANTALRLGLRAMESRAPDEAPLDRTEPVSGGPRLLNLDDPWDAIAATEGEDTR